METWIALSEREPIGSMYGIFTYIYHNNQPNVGKYTIHGSYGEQQDVFLFFIFYGFYHGQKKSMKQSPFGGLFVSYNDLKQIYIRFA